MVRILALHDLCAKGQVEFRAADPAGRPGEADCALPGGAGEEPTPRARRSHASFLERVGESGLAAWTGGAAMLGFLGESVVAC